MRDLDRKHKERMCESGPPTSRRDGQSLTFPSTPTPQSASWIMLTSFPPSPKREQKVSGFTSVICQHKLCVCVCVFYRMLPNCCLVKDRSRSPKSACMGQILLLATGGENDRLSIDDSSTVSRSCSVFYYLQQKVRSVSTLSRPAEP